MNLGRFAASAAVAFAMNAIGAFSALRSSVVAMIGLPGIALAFLIPRSLDTDTFRTVAIPVVWGGSFAIWCGLAYGLLSVLARLKRRSLAHP